MKYFLLATAIALPFGCEVHASELQEQKIETFVMLPVPDLVKYSMENRNLLFNGLFLAAKNYNATTQLTDTIKKNEPNLGEKFKLTVASHLKKSGFTELPTPDITIDPEKPDKVDYGSIVTDADAIVHVYFDSAGLQSGHTSTYYDPYLYASYCVVVKKIKNTCIIDDSAGYGYGAKKESHGTYVSAPGEKWNNAEEVENGTLSIISSFENGIRKISRGFAIDIAKFAHKTPAVSEEESNSEAGDSSRKLAEPIFSKEKNENEAAKSVVEKKEDDGFSEKLRILEKLYSEGLITKDEYDAKRREILMRL